MTYPPAADQTNVPIVVNTMGSSPAELVLLNDAMQLKGLFWTFSIEIWDLFVFWCLRFGIYFSDKVF